MEKKERDPLQDEVTTAHRSRAIRRWIVRACTDVLDFLKKAYGRRISTLLWAAEILVAIALPYLLLIIGLALKEQVAPADGKVQQKIVLPFASLDSHSLFTAFIVLFFVKEILAFIRTSRKDKNLLATINTMPSYSVISGLGNYHDSYRGLAKLLQEAPDRKKVIRQFVALSLDTLVAVVKGFHDRKVSANVSANLMYFSPADGTTTEKLARFQAMRLCEFCDCPDLKALGNLEGVLVLEPEYSSIQNDKGLALPVPRTKKDHEGRRLTLPGAPTAYAEGRAQLGDTRRILHTFEKYQNYGVEPWRIAKVQNYFNDDPGGQQIRAMLCIRMENANKEAEQKYLGVLNINASFPGLFADELMLDNFLALIDPILHNIRELIWVNQEGTLKGEKI